jgi:hypothetical protein
MADDIDERIEQGDTSTGYFYFPALCPLCGDEWHGLPTKDGCPGEWEGK